MNGVLRVLPGDSQPDDKTSAHLRHQGQRLLSVMTDVPRSRAGSARVPVIAIGVHS